MMGSTVIGWLVGKGVEEVVVVEGREGGWRRKETTTHNHHHRTLHSYLPSIPFLTIFLATMSVT